VRPTSKIVMLGCCRYM